MVSRNSIYPLPHDGAFSAHINGDHDHVSYYQKDQLGWIGEKSLFQRNALSKNPRFNISAKQDLPLPDSRIGAFEPPYIAIYIVCLGLLGFAGQQRELKRFLELTISAPGGMGYSDDGISWYIHKLWI